MKKVIIIVVNYNGFSDTVECVESLKKINYTNFEHEIIVVDNGSINDFEKLKNKLEVDNVVVLDAGSNLGFSGGNNVGIRYAIDNGADYILLLNNDTLVEPDFLNHMVRTAKENNGDAVVTNKIMCEAERNIIWYAGGSFNSKTSRTVAFGINEKDCEKYSVKCEVSFASGCCMLIPINIINAVGLMCEDYFLYCEDTDYCLRILNAGFKILYEPKAKIYHKINSSTSKIAGIQAYYLVRNKLYIISKFIKPKYRLIAYTYVYAETIKRIMTKEYDYKSVRRGLSDFKKNIKGKK